MRSSRVGGYCTVFVALAVAGCSGGGAGPDTAMLPDGQCAQLRNELNAMDRRGVPGLIDAKTNGKTNLSPQQNADINRYNQLLDTYLGGKCASDQRVKSAGITTSSTKRRTAASEQ